MLILTRRRGESIMIGDQIKVTILRNRDGLIRLGIAAPKEVQILRPEAVRKTPRTDGNR